MKNLESMFPEATGQNTRFAITSRIFYTVVLNALLFGFMIIHLALQVYHENLSKNKPTSHRLAEIEASKNLGLPEDDVEIVYMSYVGGLMLICTIVVPIFNIVIFILANYYYIIELMIKINLHVVKKEDFRKQLEEHGDVAKGILGFAGKNVHATPGRLRDIQSLTTFQRVFFVLREWWIDLIFFAWAIIIVGYCILFIEYYNSHVSITDYLGSSEEDQLFSIIYVCSFMLCISLFALGNYHSFLVVIVTIILMLPLFFSFAIQAIMDKCSEATGKTVSREKDKFAGIVTLIAKKDKGTPAPTPVLVRPSTGSSDGRPLTVHSSGKELLLPKDSPPASALAKSRPLTQKVSYRPPTGSKRSAFSNYRPHTGSQSPALSKGRVVETDRAQSNTSFVLSMTSVEEPYNYQV